ncbi:MAG: pyridoxamine 5'-phosphate oxidase [Bacteroidota bacterium]
MREDIASLREEYAKDHLDEESTAENPFLQFEKWFAEAKESEILEPNAMVVSTVSVAGEPSQRTVLLKDLDEHGFTFFSNYTSNKGQDLRHNDNISLLFPWYSLERQVVVRGKASKISREASESYFRSRPKGSQIGAVVSQQSQKIPNREVLENRLQELESRYINTEVPLPLNWGGYLIKPHFFEFWQGRKSRLHDRIIYNQTEKGWVKGRLSP